MSWNNKSISQGIVVSTKNLLTMIVSIVASVKKWNVPFSACPLLGRMRKIGDALFHCLLFFQNKKQKETGASESHCLETHQRSTIFFRLFQICNRFHLPVVRFLKCDNFIHSGKLYRLLFNGKWEKWSRNFKLKRNFHICNDTFLINLRRKLIHKFDIFSNL